MDPCLHIITHMDMDMSPCLHNLLLTQDMDMTPCLHIIAHMDMDMAPCPHIIDSHGSGYGSMSAYYHSHGLWICLHVCLFVTLNLLSLY